MIYTITDEQLGDIVELAIRNGRNWARTGYITESAVDCFNRTYEASQSIAGKTEYVCAFKNSHPASQQCDCNHE